MIKRGIVSSKWLLVVPVIVFVSPTQAQTTSKCAGITDDAARLTCYDHNAKPKEKPARPMATAPSKSGTVNYTAAMAEYRSRLERTFLEHGISVEIFTQTAQSKEKLLHCDSCKYPMITIWTYLTKATVYSLVTKAKILDQAKEVGFAMVDFWDKGNEGHWMYDLTKPGNCDISKRLCY